MGIYAICGTVSDEPALIRGNGKTLSAVYFALHNLTQNKPVYANFRIANLEPVSIENIIEKVVDENVQNAVLIFDELDKYLNSLGSSAVIVNFTDRMVSQLRKRKCSLYYTTQRFMNVHRRLRVQTDVILTPRKYHYVPPAGDGKKCDKDLCEEEHAIAIFSFKPYRQNPLLILDAGKIGRFYNADEFIYDLPDVKKIKARMTKAVKVEG